MERAFRLAGLLRLRELQEDQAAGALAVSNVALRSAQQHRRATLTTLAGHTMPAAADAAAWRTSVTTRGALTHLLADAAIDVRDAGERVAADAAVWAAARSRSVGLEKLRDQHRALVQAEDARAEQLALDEVAARSGAGRSASSGASVARGPAVRSSAALVAVATTVAAAAGGPAADPPSALEPTSRALVARRRRPAAAAAPDAVPRRTAPDGVLPHQRSRARALDPARSLPHPPVRPLAGAPTDLPTRTTEGTRA